MGRFMGWGVAGWRPCPPNPSTLPAPPPAAVAIAIAWAAPLMVPGAGAGGRFCPGTWSPVPLGPLQESSFASVFLCGKQARDWEPPCSGAAAEFKLQRPDFQIKLES